MIAANTDMVAGRPVLFVTASLAEYGVQLQKRIRNPFASGVGPIESAVNLSRALCQMEVRPALIVSFGTSLSALLPPKTVCQIGSVRYRDMDASVLGFPRGITPLIGLPDVVHLPHVVPGLPLATLSTGAQLVTDPSLDLSQQDLHDLETYAHMRAGISFGIPIIGLRGVADRTADLSKRTYWSQFLLDIDVKLAQAFDLLEDAIQSGAVLI